jgi:cytidine deaminase|tara:strand:+ start:3383 stop:4393 length:1011 start_codon:yes stop_codon:yes gene_type:complete
MHAAIPVAARTEQTASPAWQQALSAFPEALQPTIDHIRLSRGVLAHSVVTHLMATLRCDLGALMMRLLPIAQQYAVVPVSHYPVGAVAAGTDLQASGARSLYMGANFEFSSAALSSSIHAEQCAINNAWLNGQTGVAVLAISAAPCGYCRQFINELASSQDLTVLLPMRDSTVAYAYNERPFTALLPEAFGPKDLGIDGGLMNPALGQHHIGFSDGVDQHNPPALAAAALAAAAASYAPYPTDTGHAYAGVAIQLDDATIFAGRHGENAAHNPSLSPLQSALAFMHLNKPLGLTRTVVRAALAEVPTKASQVGVTTATLSAYAPLATLAYYALKQL